MFTASALFFVCFLQPESVYRSPASMALYFGASDPGPHFEWPGSWSWSEAPFKYRVLFHGAVDACAELTRLVVADDLRAYWLSLMLVSALSFALALLALSRLLASLGISAERRAIGLMLWFLLPPIHQAYALPTQTKEDFLAYALFFFGITALLERRYGTLIALSLLCALTRETLLLMPALYVVAAPRGEGFLRRLGPLAVALALHMWLRFALGFGGYDVLMLSENLASLPILLVSIALALGSGWLGIALSLGPALSGTFAQLRALIGRAPSLAHSAVRPSETSERARGDRFFALLPWVLLALVPAHLLLGRIQEIRISALLAPWAVVALLSIGRIGSPLRVLRSTALQYGLPVFALAVVLAEGLGLGRALRQHNAALLPDFATRGWWLELYLQLSMAIVVATELYARRKRARQKPAQQTTARQALTG